MKLHSSPCSCDLRRQEISVRWKKWPGEPGRGFEFPREPDITRFITTCWVKWLSTSGCEFCHHIQVLKFIHTSYFSSIYCRNIQVLLEYVLLLLLLLLLLILSLLITTISIEATWSNDTWFIDVYSTQPIVIVWSDYADRRRMIGFASMLFASMLGQLRYICTHHFHSFLNLSPLIWSPYAHTHTQFLSELIALMG